MKYRLYCILHNAAKKILGRTRLTTGNILHEPSLSLGVQPAATVAIWRKFMEDSAILSGEFSGFCYAGYIAEDRSWCLPSWIWTNAAVVRESCRSDRLEDACRLASLLAARQEKCGGWIVRNDYDSRGAVPMLAPNDSAYIANNAFLTLYEKTKDRKYLDVARRCADWVIETARPDGLVYVGYNVRDCRWDKGDVIVDVGFTGGLFARLFELTGEKKYLIFLKRFINRYVDLFYNQSKHGFSTSIDKNDNQQGGVFGRGQAWALEGLTPAYKVLGEERLRHVIDDVVANLIRIQLKNGAWPYNLTKPLLGEDCKAVSVIAKDIMEWYDMTKDEHIRASAMKALAWCCRHTASEGEAAGGIFSFCMEGAVVQSLYTSCAFVYASAYAVELYEILKQ